VKRRTPPPIPVAAERAEVKNEKIMSMAYTAGIKVI
jgi:hypothetical protein